MARSGVVPFLQEHIHWAPCKWSDFEGLTMSCLSRNDTFCQGLPGAHPPASPECAQARDGGQDPSKSDHGEAPWNFFFGYDSFRKATAPLPMMKTGHRDSSGALFSGPYLKKSSTGLGRDRRFEGLRHRTSGRIRRGVKQRPL